MNCRPDFGRLTWPALLPLLCLGAFVSSPLSGTTISAKQTARQIVERADQIRFPREGFQVDVRITSFVEDQARTVRDYRILSKGNDKTLVIVTAPPADRGQIMLMRDQDLWMFLPAISRAIRLPLSQKLSGQVANGDLARANFAGDYNPILLRVETIEGQEYHVLELVAARRGVTYHRVLYWVNKSNYRPFKAEFYSVSKRLLKSAFYQEFKTLGGAVRPSRLVLRNALKEGEQSVLDYYNMKPRELPDKVFTKQYLKKLR